MPSALHMKSTPLTVRAAAIASIGGASAVLIVTEPTVSGNHEMERVVQLAQHFKVAAMLCVNKFDFNLDVTRDEVEGNEITKKETLVPPAHEPGVLPAWLHDLGASVIIAGGMGGRAIDLFMQNSFNVIIGAPARA
jgi:hypothetical protein